MLKTLNNIKRLFMPFIFMKGLKRILFFNMCWIELE